MSNTLTFFHTSAVHIETFNRLLAELAPDIPARHVVNETILAETINAGELTPELNQRGKRLLTEAIDAETELMLCTCSTIGPCTEVDDNTHRQVIMRIDRAMAEKALELGTRIIVAATLTTTLNPTQNLLLQVAKEKEKEIELIPLLCQSAWQHFQQGNKAAYLQAVANSLKEAAPSGDVIVLAQASMADAVHLIEPLPVPILSSPRLGLEAAIKAYRAKVGR